MLPEIKVNMKLSFWNPNLLSFVLTLATKENSWLPSSVELFFTYAQTSLIQIARGIRSFRITEYFKDQFLNTSKSLEQGSVTKTKDNSWNGVLLSFSVSLPIPFLQSIARPEGLRSRSQRGTITLAPNPRDSWCRAECWCPQWTSVPIVLEELSSYNVRFLGTICSE